jgi:hypothetical protein
MSSDQSSRTLVYLAFGWLASACGGHSRHDEPATFGGATNGGIQGAITGGSSSTTAGTASMTQGGDDGSGGTNGSGNGGGGSTSGGGPSVGGRPDAAGGGGGDISSVWPSFGCGKEYTGPIGQKVTIPTSGVKDANCTAKLADGTKRCGPWGEESSTWQKAPLPRDYWLYLPPNYDPSKAYPLVFEGPGCGGNGGGVFGLPNAKDLVIRVGISPAPKSVGHADNPEQGCFDNKEGDDSLDFAFYEALYDELNDKVCFDRNRVHALGDSSGAWLANELGCKYAGDPHGRPIRSVISSVGTLPTEPEYAPTCSNQPMAGLWVYKAALDSNFSVRPNDAVSRAMQVSGCTGASDYDDAVAKGLFKDFPIGADNPDNTCQRLQTCPEAYPLVVCGAPGGFQSGTGSVTDPATGVFLKLFQPR